MLGRIKKIKKNFSWKISVFSLPQHQHAGAMSSDKRGNRSNRDNTDGWMDVEFGSNGCVNYIEMISVCAVLHIYIYIYEYNHSAHIYKTRIGVAPRLIHALQLSAIFFNYFGFVCFVIVVFGLNKHV